MTINEETRDLLDALLAAVRRTERAKLDAASTGSQRDFKRAHDREDDESDALTKFEAHLVSSLKPEVLMK